MVWHDSHDDPALVADLHHVACSAVRATVGLREAAEGKAALRVSMVERVLIPNWASFAPKAPIRRISLYRPPKRHSDVVRNFVGALVSFAVFASFAVAAVNECYLTAIMRMIKP